MRTFHLSILLLIYTVALLSGCARSSTVVPSVALNASGVFQEGAFDRLTYALERERTTGVIPAASLAVYAEGQVVYLAHFGRLVPFDEQSPRVGDDTLFDLASLTKTLAGAPAEVMYASRPRGGAPDMARVVLHRLPIPDETYIPMMLRATSTDQVREIFSSATQEHRILPGDRYWYSNTAWFGMGAWAAPDLEAAEEELARVWWSNSGSDTLTYRPDALRAVASGRDVNDEWLRGVPFDPLAHYAIARLGMAPLHSGLFGTAESVARFGGAIASRSTGHSILRSGARPVTNVQTGDPLVVSNFGMLCATDPPFATPSARRGRFYHQSGYTGCLLWIDAEKETSVALLTNASAVDADESFRALSADIIATVLRGYSR